MAGKSDAWLRRFVCGEYGLSRTYWLGWWLGGAVAILPLVLFMVGAEAVDSAVAVALALTLGLGIYGGYNALAMIGIWRAADAYRGWRGWAVWAKLNVGLAWIGLSVLALGLAFALASLPID